MCTYSNATAEKNTSENLENVQETPSRFKRHRFDPLDNVVSVLPEVTFDTNLNSNAKVLLIALFHAPEDWTIQLGYFANRMGIGRDAIRTAMNNLIEVGYVKRTKVKDSKGLFSNYEYEYSLKPIFKQSIISNNNSKESSVETNSKNSSSAWKSGAGKPVTTNVYSIYNNHQPPPTSSKQSPDSGGGLRSVGGSPTIETLATESNQVEAKQDGNITYIPKPARVEIWPSLANLGIPEESKKEFTYRFDQELVDKAVAYCTAPGSKIHKNLESKIGYYLNHPEHMTLTKEQKQKQVQLEIDQKQIKTEKRRTYAEKYRRSFEKQFPGRDISLWTCFEYLEINQNNVKTKIYFTNDRFKEELKHILAKYEMPIGATLEEVP